MRPVASPLFQGLSAEEWAALEQSGCLRTKSYPRHAVIFHAGAQVHALGVVLRGTVHIENLDLWGSKSILSSISAGQAFAETYALCGDVMMVDAVAAEECEVLFVNISAFSGGAPGTVGQAASALARQFTGISLSQTAADIWQSVSAIFFNKS